MAWPDDARYVSYSANQQVKAAELNEFQDQIYANHANIDTLTTNVNALKDIKSVIVTTPFEVATQDELSFAASGGVLGEWTFPGGTGKYFFYECKVPTDGATGSSPAVLTEVHAKVFNNHASAQNWTLDVIRQDLEFGSSATAPSGANIKTQTTSIVEVGGGGGGGTGFGVISCTAINSTIGTDHSVFAVVGPTYDVGDICYGVRFEFKPIG